ncbi:MAG: hypothetical protein FRX49_06255 [Trebouxia sp. A1-2]|nr:MAG: hypothetical protein FRX49_06255 [Trebouxia sp. A1-2]
MLKLSALQPHLTAADALNQRAAWVQGGRASKDSSHSGITNRHARTQDWHAQGQELTGSHQPKRQLSVCIQLEVKLAEALDKCDSLCPPQADDHGQLRPNKLRTAVCCKEEVAVIEGQVAELKGLVQHQDALNAGLQQRVQSGSEAEARAKVEAVAAKDELKRLRKEMLRLKNEWSSLRALYESAKASEAFEVQVAELRESIRAGAEEAAELRAKLATVVPREQLTAAEQRIKELEKMVQQARRESVKADDLVRSLTPRPNWHKLDAFSQPLALPATPLPQGQLPPLTKGQPQGQGPQSVSATQQPALHCTRETVDQLVAERKQALARVRELEPLQEQLQQALSLLEPEAAPSPTIAAVNASGTQMVDGLGWTSQVARCLRWDSHVTLQPYSLQTLYNRIQDIWAAKAAFDGQRMAQHPLLGFLWTYFRAEHGEQASVAQEGYSFLYALQQYQHQLAMADIFLRVVEGQWQEGDSQPEGVHSLVSVVDIQLVLQHLFPLKSEADVSAAIKAVSSANQITISALMPIHRSSGQWASTTQPPSQFVEALQRQYMLDIDNRFANLQRTLTSDLSASLPASIAKHRVLKWDSSITEAEVEGVMHDMLLSNNAANQLSSVSADVDVKALIAVVSTMTPWPRLHAFYELESTLLFVRQIHESDGGMHSAGELPEVA